MVITTKLIMKMIRMTKTWPLINEKKDSWSFLFPPWEDNEKYDLDQSEAASHTMRHKLSLPPFSFAFDQWKNSVTGGEESCTMSPYHIDKRLCPYDDNNDDHDDKKSGDLLPLCCAGHPSSHFAASWHWQDDTFNACNKIMMMTIRIQ